MRLSRASAVLLTTLASPATSLLLSPGSPCSRYCGNVLSSTSPTDIECFANPDDFRTTSDGRVFQDCLTCQSSSTYAASGQSDLQWLIYNLRFSVSLCLFGEPESDRKKLGSTPCVTSTACGPLKDALAWKNLTTDAGQYDFCQAWHTNDFNKCRPCLGSGQPILANFMTMLDAACAQRPELGSTISVSGLPFSSTQIKATEPTPTGYEFVPDNGPLNLGAKVGIAAGGVVLLLLVAGCGIVCNGKRRRRRYLRDVEKRHADAQAHGFGHGGSPAARWPVSHAGGSGDMYETPVSAKPLFGGWENSPVSAHTDHASMSTGLSPAGAAGPSNFPSRYFSPYASPVNEQAATMHQWPAMTHEKLTQMELEREQHYQQQQQFQMQRHYHLQLQQQRLYEQQQQQQQHLSPQHLSPQDIGVALGGDDPSLRSKKSEQSFVSKLSSEDAAAFPPPPPPNPPPKQPLSSNPWGLVDVKGKHPDYNTEAYELHEVDSNGSLRVPTVTAQQAPVLQHPGFGRYPPPPPPVVASRKQWV